MPKSVNFIGKGKQIEGLDVELDQIQRMEQGLLQGGSAAPMKARLKVEHVSGAEEEGKDRHERKRWQKAWEVVKMVSDLAGTGF